MLRLLLDQNLSQEIAKQIRAKRPKIVIFSLPDWRGGALLDRADERILEAAAEDALTLVTYDRKTIPPLLAEWVLAGVSHGGVIFVDNRTISSNDFGRLVRSLLYFWDSESENDWTNRVGFLPAPR